MAIDRGTGSAADRTGELPVGQLAARAGVRTDTVRYYERAGLLPPAACPDPVPGTWRAQTDVLGPRRTDVRLLPVAEAVIRIAGPADAPALAALRRAWTAESRAPADDPGADDPGADDPGADDPGFEARFRDWWERESGRRLSWLAELSGTPVGMMNLAVFDRMPRPGRPPSRWGYLANAFVLAGQRDQGIGARLLRALLAHADEQRYARVVLSPSERAVPFYQRHGFTADHGLLVRPGTG